MAAPTTKQKFFCREYLVDLNGSKAAVRAGYSKKTARQIASKLVTVLDNFGFPLGGESFFQANFEYIFLVGGPFRVLLFADAGNVFLDSEDFSNFDFRYTAGIELQVNVPLFGAPLRFIYAQNPDSFEDDRFETFQFSIGPSF